eukprot:TRINITY_DN1753_c0_g1_i4.p1 TRINITY_DN1753_c0_g1~~TRINITY_DN1753_c0_g1_i4.p1  ORF type:complete len:103 (-),score=15.34 TRINITY_DN1753_c0_g1_i4:43-351(-)
MVRESSEQTLYARNQLAPTDRERSMDALMKSTKISALMKELYRLRQDDRSIKSIVFSQWTGMVGYSAWKLKNIEKTSSIFCIRSLMKDIQHRRLIFKTNKKN